MCRILRAKRSVPQHASGAKPDKVATADVAVQIEVRMAAKTTSKRKTNDKPKRAISSSLVDSVCQRLARNQRVRRTLPNKGRLHIDRQLPFLCVYRQPPNYDDAGTERLVKGEASYLVAPGAKHVSRRRHESGA